MKKFSYFGALGLVFSIAVSSVSSLGAMEGVKQTMRRLREPEEAERKVIMGAAALVAIIGGIYLGKAGAKLLINPRVKKLREKFPNFKESALKLGAMAGIHGLKSLISNIAYGKMVKLSNPFKALKEIAADPENVAAIAEATGKQPAYVKDMLENASYRQALLGM